MEGCLSTLTRIADEATSSRGQIGHSLRLCRARRKGGESQLLTVEATAQLEGIGRTAAYEAARRCQIPSLRLGRRVLFPRRALSRLLSGKEP